MKDAERPTIVGTLRKKATFPRLVIIVSETASVKFDSVNVPVAKYTTAPFTAERRLLAILSLTLFSDAFVALKKYSVTLTLVAVSDRPKTVEPDKIVTKEFTTVDDVTAIVTFVPDARTAALCSVLDNILRLAFCSVPDCVIAATVEEVIVTDAPVPARVTISPLQPVNEYDVKLDVVVVWHGVELTPVTIIIIVIRRSSSSCQGIRNISLIDAKVIRRDVVFDEDAYFAGGRDFLQLECSKRVASTVRFEEVVVLCISGRVCEKVDLPFFCTKVSTFSYLTDLEVTH